MYTSPTFLAVPAMYSDDSSACGPYLQSKRSVLASFRRTYMQYTPDLLVPHDLPNLLRARIKHAPRGVVDRRQNEVRRDQDVVLRLQLALRERRRRALRRG